GEAARRPLQQARCSKRPEPVSEGEAETRQPHQRQADEYRAPSAQSRSGDAAGEAAEERAACVRGDERAGSRLRQVEVVREMREERRERREEHRVDPDERADEDKEAAHCFQPKCALPFGCDDSGCRRRMTGVNAVPAAVRPSGRVGAPPFADVVAEHLDAVYRYLVYLTGDRAAAEDLAAETFERAFRSWRRFDPRRGAPRTWLCRIARSAAVDWLGAEARRHRRGETYTRDEPLPEETVFAEGRSPELERALRRLTPAEREVVALRVLL